MGKERNDRLVTRAVELHRFAIYQGTYYQLKGPKTPIPGYYTLNPAGWGNGIMAEQQTSETGAGKRVETFYWAGVFLWAGIARLPFFRTREHEQLIVAVRS